MILTIAYILNYLDRMSVGFAALTSAFVVGPASFYVVRLLLGAAEAGFFPGVTFER